ncbi:pyroglutamyl-peptidase I [Globicatella sp. HMSC072A10]|uniref:pyroglutamyl-peptidase I n=1 Tax=Globicatella sp. HMSC072A10 TaxID=1739315 RepID=UPI0008B0C00C|nr:pyroglutamyl-peptidase I [Globicatella sp. HMSC072A10]OFK60211.1 pyroglutamyl-peptidase I [Globicatella sp. HMSC072A10]
MKKILVTGFDPFGGEQINPALEAIKRLPTLINDTQILTYEIPTVFHKSGRLLQDYLLKEQPDAVLLVGQAGGRSAISLERVAINMDDARIPDNEGNQPIDEVINPQGAPAYFTTLPIKRIVQALKQHQIPAIVSNSAGTFVCNHLMYYLLDILAARKANVIGGFMHIPYLPSQVVDQPNQPSMALDQIVKAIEITLATIIKNQHDLKITGGTEV